MKTLFAVTFAATLVLHPAFATHVTVSSSSALSSAINAASNGDTIYVRSGTYGALTITNKSFTAPLTIAAYPGEERQAIFSAGTYGSGKSLSIRDCKNIRILNLTFRTALWVVMIENSHTITIEGCKIHDAGQEAVVVRYLDGEKRGGSSQITIKGCEIFDTGKRGADYVIYGEGIYIGDGRSGGENDTTNNVSVIGCDIHHTSAEAVDLKRSNYSHDYLIDGNRIHDIATNVRAAINVLEGPRGNERGYVLRNNRIWNVTGVRYTMDGSGIRIFGDDVYVYNNVIYNCSYTGILDDEEYRGGTNYVYNNTCANNGGSANRNIVIEAAKSTQDVKNNIGFSGAGTANIQASDALFVNATGADYHLKSTATPAIDKGVTVALVAADVAGSPRPSGGGYDIGAYEYQSGTYVPRMAPRSPRIAQELKPGVFLRLRAGAGALVIAPVNGEPRRSSLLGRNNIP